jgi:hypothetical protein
MSVHYVAMEQVIVVNKKATEPRGYTVLYIGRPSVLGNRFKMYDERERKWVVNQYRDWLRNEWLLQTSVRRELEALAERVRDGECIALQCFCAPLACHGDVIKEAIEGINRRHNAHLLAND